MSKINKILAVLIAVLAIAIIAIGAIWYFRSGNGDNYYAVYLETGDLYFGKLSRFPYLTLSDVWYLQRGQNQNVSLSDFSKTAWGPENFIRLNRDKIVWITRISNASQLIPVLSGQSIPYLPANGQNVAPSSPATSTP